jgi:hypothetical protein
LQTAKEGEMKTRSCHDRFNSGDWLFR